MDKAKTKQLAQDIFAKAMAKGCQAAEIFYSSGESVDIRVRGGEIDAYDVQADRGMTLRVKVNGKDGYAYTEQMSDIDSLIDRAMDNANSTESADERPMFSGAEYQPVAMPPCPGAKLTPVEMIDLAHEIERRAAVADKRFSRVRFCGVQRSDSSVALHNSQGLCAEHDGQYCGIYLGVILNQDGVDRDGFAWRSNADFDDIDGMVAEATAIAAGKFGAQPTQSGEYAIVLQNRAAANLLEAFSPMFSSEKAQKKLSLLAGKEGESIAAPCLSILDDPTDMINPRPFDGEGVPSQCTEVMEKGVLKTLLYDLKTAKKAGLSSTSNAGRGSGGISVQPSNFYIKKGAGTEKQLLERMGDGLLICELGGLHAGVSTISGDFSLIASGFEVKDGKCVRPINQVTVAGNFLKLMQKVTAVGEDLRFGPPHGSAVGSPSLLISSLMVSGK